MEVVVVIKVNHIGHSIGQSQTSRGHHLTHGFGGRLTRHHNLLGLNHLHHEADQAINDAHDNLQGPKHCSLVLMLFLAFPHEHAAVHNNWSESRVITSMYSTAFLACNHIRPMQMKLYMMLMTICRGPSGTPQWCVSGHSSGLCAVLLAEPGSSLQSSHVPECSSCSKVFQC